MRISNNKPKDSEIDIVDDTSNEIARRLKTVNRNKDVPQPNRA